MEDTSSENNLKALVDEEEEEITLSKASIGSQQISANTHSEEGKTLKNMITDLVSEKAKLLKAAKENSTLLENEIASIVTNSSYANRSLHYLKGADTYMISVFQSMPPSSSLPTSTSSASPSITKSSVSETYSPSATTTTTGSNVVGSLNTKTIVLKDYNYPSFYWIRHHHLKLNEDDYLKSICSGDFNFSLGIGKGSSLTMKTHDDIYFIKDISKVESDCLKSTLAIGLKNHLSSNPNSLLAPIVGHHKIQFKPKDLRVIIMPNIFYGGENKPDRVYDLKGSTVGRHGTKSEKDAHQYKDLDILDQQKMIMVGKQVAQDLKDQIGIDVKFLASNHIMDYSLLIGVKTITDSMLLSEKKKSYCTVAMSEDGKELYSFAIIDYLQKWTFKKKAAAQYKGVLHDKGTISSLNPEDYAKRFLSFISSLLQ